MLSLVFCGVRVNIHVLVDTLEVQRFSFGPSVDKTCGSKGCGKFCFICGYRGQDMAYLPFPA